MTWVGVLMISLPDKEEVIEVDYTKNSVTVLNSNSLGYTKVTSNKELQDLPDGLYTIKMTVCPYEIFWYEQDYYRICQLQCKYDKVLLKLDIDKCEKCYNAQYIDKLALARVYMDGIIANAKNDNINQATSLYKAANNILDTLLDSCNKNGKHCY